MLHLPGGGAGGRPGRGLRRAGNGAAGPLCVRAALLAPGFGKSDFTGVWHRGCSNLRHHRWRLWFVILAYKSLIRAEMLHLMKWKIQNPFYFAFAHFDLIFF